MRVFINGVDLSRHLNLRQIDGQLWLPIDLVSELGVHVHETPQLSALMVCTEIECAPFTTQGQDKQAICEGGQWLVKWDAMAKVLACQWECRDDEIFVNLPTAPLPRPLKLGEKVPDMVLWRHDGIMMRLYDWAGKPFVLLLKPNRRENLGERVLPVKFTLDTSGLPEGAYADPFGMALQIFGNVLAVGVSADLKWVATFDDLKSVSDWLENEQTANPEFVPTLTVILSAWLETVKNPESAQAWLTLADVQRLYCEANTAVASYERAIKLGSQNEPEIEMWARWRLGALKWLIGDKDGAREVWSQGKLPETGRELVSALLR